MITLKLLKVSEFYACSHTIDVAKGINKLPTTLKEGINYYKRKKAWNSTQ